MYKWIGAVVVLLLILGSLMTSGLVTALLDLTAFLVLLALVWIRAVKSSDKKQNNESDNGNESTPVFKADYTNSKNIDITP
ncbi:hypothetical protein [Photobacterium profundum]|uniref:hypothetical protein n=1 Tax=Photobacterium profundum TaxID=74109 RepID=UPI0003054802|nr:hypothetical protein [Photobacterium profundum]